MVKDHNYLGATVLQEAATPIVEAAHSIGFGYQPNPEDCMAL